MMYVTIVMSGSLIAAIMRSGRAHEQSERLEVKSQYTEKIVLRILLFLFECLSGKQEISILRQEDNQE